MPPLPPPAIETLPERADTGEAGREAAAAAAAGHDDDDVKWSVSSFVAPFIAEGYGRADFSRVIQLVIRVCSVEGGTRTHHSGDWIMMAMPLALRVVGLI